MSDHTYKLPNCYIYFYHTDEFFILPQYPKSITDSLESSFNSQNALSRTAPVFSYNNSGPRVTQVPLTLHRDMMNNVNKNNSYIKVNTNDSSGVIVNVDDDYVDLLIKKLQAVALPRYDSTSKLVDPPRVAVRFGNEIFVKGVVTGGISLSYELPLLANNKYAQVSITFNVSETQGYDAKSIGEVGSFRGLTSGLMNRINNINKGVSL